MTVTYGYYYISKICIIFSLLCTASPWTSSFLFGNCFKKTVISENLRGCEYLKGEGGLSGGGVAPSGRSEAAGGEGWGILAGVNSKKSKLQIKYDYEMIIIIMLASSQMLLPLTVTTPPHTRHPLPLPLPLPHPRPCWPTPPFKLCQKLQGEPK